MTESEEQSENKGSSSIKKLSCVTMIWVASFVFLTSFLVFFLGLLYGVSYIDCYSEYEKSELHTFKSQKTIFLELDNTHVKRSNVYIDVSPEYKSISLLLKKSVSSLQKDKINNFNTNVESTEDNLKIKLEYIGKFGLLHGCPLFIAYLRLPYQVYRSITVSSSSVDVSMINLPAYELNIVSRDSNMDIQNSDISLVNLKNDNGKISLNNMIIDTEMRVKMDNIGTLVLSNVKGMYNGIMELNNVNTTFNEVHMAPSNNSKMNINSRGLIQIKEWKDGNLTAQTSESITVSVETKPKYLDIESNGGYGVTNNMEGYTTLEGSHQNHFIGTHGGVNNNYSMVLQAMFEVDVF